MSNVETSILTPQPTKPGSAILQLVLSALAAVLLIGTAAILVLVDLVKFITPGTARSDPTQTFLLASSLAFIGVLVLPSAWYSWKALSNPQAEPAQKSEQGSFGLILTIVALVLVSGALLLGNWVSVNTQLAWLLLPPLNIIATGLPALWLVYIGIRGLPLGSRRRRWGVFASGLVLGPLIIIFLELIALIVIGILALLWALVTPSLSSQLYNLAIRLQQSSSNPEAILRILLPYLLNPGILLIGFSFIAIIVPMIEEALKPLGVWFLSGQKLTPAQGFVYGVLSGAGFGLFENLGNTSGGGEAWALVASSRISALLVHCFTAGLVGWALVSAWSQRRYLRLGISYIAAVLVHGLWNAMGLVSAASSLEGLSNVSLPANLQQLSSASDVGIIVLGTIVLVSYISFNAVLRRNLTGKDSPPPLVGETTQQSLEITSPPTNERPHANENSPQEHTSGEIPPATTDTNL